MQLNLGDLHRIIFQFAGLVLRMRSEGHPVEHVFTQIHSPALEGGLKEVIAKLAYDLPIETAAITSEIIHEFSQAVSTKIVEKMAGLDAQQNTIIEKP